MLKTEYGNFNGDSWEKICQMSFKRKYETESYLEIVASPGDYGIEGFTRTGKAFQCYCPDEHYTSEALYVKQRDKISTDLKKLKTYSKQLAKKFGDTKISKWYFVSPYYSRNEIVDHCTKKTEEVRKWNLNIIDNDNFQVIPADIDFLKPEVHQLLKTTDQKLEINPSTTSTQEEILKWKDKEISLIESAQRKHKARFPPMVSKLEEKVDSLTDKSVSHFMDGAIILSKWRSDYPEDYEKFLKVVSQFEEKVVEECMFPTDDNNARYNNFAIGMKQKLKENFSFLDDTTIEDLCNYVLSDWILRCPIDFD